MTKSYFFNNSVYTENQLFKKVGKSPNDLDGAYLIILDTPDLSSIYRYPTGEKRYEIDEKNKVCLQKIVYAERNLKEIKVLAIQKIKKEIKDKLNIVCNGIDPTIVMCSSLESNKNRLKNLSDSFYKKIEEIQKSETATEIKNIVDSPYNLSL